MGPWLFLIFSIAPYGSMFSAISFLEWSFLIGAILGIIGGALQLDHTFRPLWATKHPNPNAIASIETAKILETVSEKVFRSESVKK